MINSKRDPAISILLVPEYVSRIPTTKSSWCIRIYVSHISVQGTLSDPRRIGQGIKVDATVVIIIEVIDPRDGNLETQSFVILSLNISYKRLVC